MSETRVQAATLICKIFLRYLDQRPDQGAMLDLWLKILDVLDRMINSGQGDSLVSYSFTIQEKGISSNVIYRRRLFLKASKISSWLWQMEGT